MSSFEFSKICSVHYPILPSFDLLIDEAILSIYFIGLIVVCYYYSYISPPNNAFNLSISRPSPVQAGVGAVGQEGREGDSYLVQCQLLEYGGEREREGAQGAIGITM